MNTLRRKTYKMVRVNSKLTYHSALKEDLKGLTELKQFKKDGDIFFFHDVTKGNNPKFNNCDCIYSEISWKAGFDKFQKRANIRGNLFNDYLKGVLDIVDKQNKPTFITGGKHMTNIINPHKTFNIKLHNYDSLLFVWNYNGKDLNGMTNFEVQDYIANKYNKILNFSVGYGSLVYFTQKYNKNIIGSDINQKCINFIKIKYYK